MTAQVTELNNKLSAEGVTPETFQLQDVRAGDAAAAAAAAPAGAAAHRGRNTHTHTFIPSHLVSCSFTTLTNELAFRRPMGQLI